MISAKEAREMMKTDWSTDNMYQAASHEIEQHIIKAATQGKMHCVVNITSFKLATPAVAQLIQEIRSQGFLISERIEWPPGYDTAWVEISITWSEVKQRPLSIWSWRDSL